MNAVRLPKYQLTLPTVLAYYDLAKSTLDTSDASATAIGAVMSGL